MPFVIIPWDCPHLLGCRSNFCSNLILKFCFSFGYGSLAFHPNLAFHKAKNSLLFPCWPITQAWHLSWSLGSDSPQGISRSLNFTIFFHTMASRSTFFLLISLVKLLLLYLITGILSLPASWLPVSSPFCHFKIVPKNDTSTWDVAWSVWVQQRLSFHYHSPSYCHLSFSGGICALMTLLDIME